MLKNVQRIHKKLNQKMKICWKPKFVCILIAGLFVAFSITTYSSNISIQETIKKLATVTYYIKQEKTSADNLGLLKELKQLKELLGEIDNLSNLKNVSISHQQRTEKYRTLPAEKEDSSDSFTDESWEEIQKNYRKLLQNECSKFKNGTYKMFSRDELLSSNQHQLQNLIVDDHHKAIYCYIPKVACTQWKRLLMVLTDRYKTVDPESINSIIAHYSSGLDSLANTKFKEEDIIEKLSNYKKFLIVRHPLERLMSAFLDKFQGTNRDAKTFQRFYASKMMVFSRNDTKVNNDGSGMKFKEFLYYLANHDPLIFQEHWKPYFYLCHPCVVNYDFIGKFENLEMDSNNILKRLEVPTNLTFPHFKPSNTKKIYNQMMLDIPLNLIERIKELYDPDFRLFGYS